MKQTLKDFVNGVIYTFAFVGICATAWTAITLVHQRHCPAYRAHAQWSQENGCSWFWCDHYNGK